MAFLGTIWDINVYRSVWLTFPAPVDPATASIFPFSRYRLMFLRTGVIYKLVKKSPGSLPKCPFALFSCLIFSNNSLIPCGRNVCTEQVDNVKKWHVLCHFTEVPSSGPEAQRHQLKMLSGTTDSPAEHLHCATV